MGLLPDLEESSCSSNVCRNGGTCLSTLTGPKCHCPLQYSGRQCEEEVTVETPGFVGKLPFFVRNLVKIQEIRLQDQNYSHYWKIWRTNICIHTGILNLLSNLTEFFQDILYWFIKYQITETVLSILC